MTAPFPSTAAEWVIRLEQAALSEDEAQALDEWLSDDPTRLRELEEISLVSHLATCAAAEISSTSSPPGVKHQSQQRSFARRTLWGAALAIAASVCAAIVIKGFPHTSSPFLDSGSNVKTAIGQIQSFELPDNSSVMIAPDSVVAVNFTPEYRGIVLNKGEMYFDVSRDRARPFVITAGTHSVKVTGTKFNLDYNSARNELEVAVMEGSVRVTTGDHAVEEISRGDVVLFNDTNKILRRKITAEQASAWRNGVFVFDETPLRETLTEMNRYSIKPLVTASANMEELTIIGQFNARDTSAFLFALKSIFGFHITETADAWILEETE